MSTFGKPRQIEINFPEADLDRLQRRLDDARLPDADIADGLKPWEYGTELSKLRQVLDDWKSGNPKDNHNKPVGTADQEVKKWWRGIESQLNLFPHYMVQIEGIDIHYQHFKPSVSNQEAGEPAIPFIFSHGWPGCFTEAQHFARKLAESTSPRFEVIVPSLPGYGLSQAPGKKDWTLIDTARILDTLMTSVLGFTSYMAQGGDWGSLVTRFLANHPGCKIAHINHAVPYPPKWSLPLLALENMGYKGVAPGGLKLMGYHPQEVLGIQRAFEYLNQGNGYARIQSTQPATIGYSLYDNPVGILSWIMEKFDAWSDPRCAAVNRSNSHIDPRSHVTDETVLTVVMIYYLTNTIHTSFLNYKESMDYFVKPNWKLWEQAKDKPFGYTSFPYELAAGPRSWLKKYRLNWQYYKMHDFGGHFAALDNPDALLEDMQEFANQHWPGV